MYLKVGVRGDKLSLLRGELAISAIRHGNPDAQVERKILDGVKSPMGRSLAKQKRSNRTFDAQLTEALLEGKVDLAVFNMKDLPFLKKDSPLILAATPERSSPYEALVTREGDSLTDLKPGKRVGTSTLLRVAQLRRARPDLKVQGVGGRLEDRLFRLDRGEIDALIVAESGLAQLGMTGRISQRLPLNSFLPTPCQGVTAIVSRRDNPKAMESVKVLDNRPTRAEAELERGVETMLRSDCNIPVGCYSTVRGERLEVTSAVLSPDGETIFHASEIGHIEDSTSLAKSIVQSLISQGARSLEESWRGFYPMEDD